MKLHLIGGFLGSGKTTAIRHACHLLQAEGRKLAVITNDQGNALVDTRFIRGSGILAGEVLNGCFCCNYHQLEASIEGLSAHGRPEIIFAESVGSCTDLIATVAKPFTAFHGEIRVTISIFADAELMHSIITGRASFLDESVQYIYKKQLAEADILVVNKIDLLEPGALALLRTLIESEYPTHRIIYQNSLEEGCIAEWVGILDTFGSDGRRQSLEVDYEIYGTGEARLAWFDAEIDITSSNSKAFETGLQLIQAVHSAITGRAFFIAHLKFFLDDGLEQMKISYTANGHQQPQNVHRFQPARTISMLINARVQTGPDLLEEIIVASAKKVSLESGALFEWKKRSSFKPGFPKPTYRFAD